MRKIGFLSFGHRSLSAGLADAHRRGRRSVADPFPSLTEREREVLAPVAAGKGTAIAHNLMISVKTVRNHVSNMLTKL